MPVSNTLMDKAIRYISDPNNLWQQFKKGSFTRDLEVMTQFSLDDAGAVKVQSNSFTGAAANYDGWGSVGNDGGASQTAGVIRANTGWIVYQLDQKKYYGMPIDTIEAEESLNNFISRVNGLMKYKVAVDVDQYRLSKLVASAGLALDGAVDTTTATQLPVTGTEISRTNILQTIEYMAAQMAENEVTVDNYILYTTPAIMRIIEDSDKMLRFINVREVDRDGVNFIIRFIETANGRIDLVSIPTKYFCTFTAGTQAQGPRAWTHNVNSVGAPDTQFRLLMIARPAINAVVKVNEARVMPSGTIRGFLGDMFELFLYHDIFVIDRRIAVGTPDANLLTGVAFNAVISLRVAPPSP